MCKEFCFDGGPESIEDVAIDAIDLLHGSPIERDIILERLDDLTNLVSVLKAQVDLNTQVVDPDADTIEEQLETLGVELDAQSELTDAKLDTLLVLVKSRIERIGKIEDKLKAHWLRIAKLERKVK